MYSNVLYFSNLNAIGGVESWLYYISKLYADYDLTILYTTGDVKQVKRLCKNVRCRKWKKSKFKCKKLFVNYNQDIVDYADAEEIYFFIHSDYKEMCRMGQLSKEHILEIANDKRITKFVAVSQLVANSFEELTGIKPEVCYNPIVIDEPKKLIRLCSAQRMTKEKGGKRIRELADALNRYCYSHDATFQWDVYTIDKDISAPSNLRYLPPNLEVTRLFGYYDYFVALSDNEGYCYSVVEALCMGVPCVVTPCPVFSELGLTENNSIKLEFDCSNVDSVAEQIFAKDLKGFKYEPPQTTFKDFLALDPSTYTDEEKERNKVDTIKIKCERSFYDIALGKHHRPSDPPFEAEIGRAEYLINKGLVRAVNERIE